MVVSDGKFYRLPREKDSDHLCVKEFLLLDLKAQCCLSSAYYFVRKRGTSNELIRVENRTGRRLVAKLTFSAFTHRQNLTSALTKEQLKVPTLQSC